MELAVGIDLGGTAIKGGLVTAEGAIVHRASIATRAAEGVDAVIDRIAELAEALHRHAAARHEAPVGIGVGTPGTIRRSDGVVISAPNLPGWTNIPLAAELSNALGVSVLVNNDANNAALGEFACGAGRGLNDMVMLTLGTGVGGGVICNGQLYVGSTGNAAELGHVIVQPGGRRCNCGQLGCLEAYSSAATTAQRAQEAIDAGTRSILQRILDEGQVISAEDVVRAAASGDATASQVWGETCRYLALACINFQHVFDPDCIVLAGGMSDAGEQLLAPVNKAVAEMISPTLSPPPRIKLAELGNDAGFVGAALSVLR